MAQKVTGFFLASDGVMMCLFLFAESFEPNEQVH
jgi:hypothetical protein